MASLALYNIFHFYLNDTLLSFFGVILIFFHPFSIESFSTFHTFELQFISPIFFCYFFLELKKNYSLSKNIFFSIIIGALLLARQNYAVYLAFLSIAFYQKEFQKVLISFLSHLIPLSIYYIYLQHIGLEYVNHEIQTYNQGFFLLDYMSQHQFKEFFIEIGFSILYFVKSIISYYLLIIIFLFRGLDKIHFTKNYYGLIITITFFLFLQFLVARKYDISYMVSDISIWVVYFTLNSIKNNSYFYNRINIIAIIYSIICIFSIINFPLKNPKNFDFRNTKVLNQRKDMIENFENYTDDDRKKARNGNLINIE